MPITTWDCETTITPSFKRKANPFDPANWVVTHGWKPAGAEGVTEVRFGDSRPPPGWLIPVLKGTKFLAGFNIKFDLLHALQDKENLAAWMQYVAEGGSVWDAQLAEYLLCGMGQRDQMLSLDEVAPRYGGNVKIDEVKALWSACVQTQDIEPALLSRYLCGGEDETGAFQLGDVENTEKIALAQIQRAKDCGQLNSILLNMGALLFTVEAERNGMFVDKARGLDIAAALQERVATLAESLNGHLPQDLPFTFNWGSSKQKSALFFGGTVQWDAYEYDTEGGGTVFRHDLESIPPGERPKLVYASRTEVHVKLTNGKTMEQSLWEHLKGNPDGSHTEAEVYASGKNAGEVKTCKVKVPDLSKPKGRNKKADYVFPRMTEPSKEWAGSVPGVWSTSSDVIEELGKRDIPFLKLFSDLQSLTKDLGTYYITTDTSGESKGMLTLVGDDGIVHHSLNMCSTVTGRLSSSNPNLQNIPKGNKSDVKTLFVSRFTGGKLIQSDFSSLEVYVQAILTNCGNLIDDLKSGLDLHCVRLAAKEGMPYEEVVKLAKGYTDAAWVWVPSVPEWDYKRTAAKTYSFQRAYGAGISKIAQETGMAQEEVQRLADAEDERYPEIPRYYSDLTDSIKQNRKPSGVTIPHPTVPGVMCTLGASSYRTPDGKLYRYTEQPSPEFLAKRGTFASFSPTEIRNYVVQGTGGEWAKAAMWLTVRSFYASGNFGGKALLVNQVHDAVYVDAEDAVAFEAAALLHACMEGASDFMEYAFAWPIPLPVPSDTTWGASMKDEAPIPGVTERAAELRQTLRDDYMDGYTPSFV